MTDNQKLMRLRQRILGRKDGVRDTISQFTQENRLRGIDKELANNLQVVISATYDAIISDIDSLIMEGTPNE